MNQNFSRVETIKFIREIDKIEYEITEEELSIELDDIFSKIIEETFEFEFKKFKDFLIVSDLGQSLILKKLNYNIKRLYKEEQANRKLIISQVKILLEENCSFWILRTDIKSFYESIDRNRIIEKLKDDAMLSYHSMYLIGKIFSNEKVYGDLGLPRGLNISATLSEIYMRKFDRWTQRFQGVYYYARFVDDIIVFFYSEKAMIRYRNELDTSLNELCYGLEKNEFKTTEFNGARLSVNTPLSYLGYKFWKEKDKLKICIADNKIKKIKTRVIQSYLDYFKNKNFSLLEKRIKFLTGNYSIRKNKSGTELKAGIHYNYFQINDITGLMNLDHFHKKIIFSEKKAFGKKICKHLDNTKKNKLKKYTFLSGHQNKIYTSFSNEEMKLIVSCW